MSAAVSALSNDSRSITWHQWHAEYPTDSSIGLFSARARANASSPHGYQSTGLCACCSRYGLVSRARRFSLMPPSARERQVADRRPDRLPLAADLDARAGRRPLASHERQRERAAERRSARRAGDPADGRVAGPDLGAGRRRLAAVEDETAEMPVHVAAVTDAHHHFLSRIASLRLRHERLERDLGQEHGGIDVVTEA